MAQKGVQLDRETFSCSICLDLLKDPVAIPCGHSYCMGCINKHWDTQDDQKICSCPQCRQTFKQRPALVTNTMLAVLVEELKKTGLQADHCYAAPEDVACDFCTVRKCKAIKSCLQCGASYCKEHLQPHFEILAFRKHKLAEPSKKLQENICSLHSEVMKMFCRTDQQSICYLCSFDQHKGHDTVTAAAERTERQRELQGGRQNIQRRIEERERDLKLLQQDVEAINDSADKAVKKSEEIFTELIRLVKQRRSEVKQQLRSQQEAEVSRVKELQEKLEQEITELKSKDAALEKLSVTEDDIQFLLDHSSLSKLPEPAASKNTNTRSLTYYEDVTAAVTALRDKLWDLLSEKWTNLSNVVTDVDLFGQSHQEPETRAQFLRYACDIMMDQDTAHECLLLADENRKVTYYVYQVQPYYYSSERFMNSKQVISQETLTGRCYWEVDWRGAGFGLAVAYGSISRAGSGEESEFGYNDKSWALSVGKSSYGFHHNRVKTPVSGPYYSRIGVYLDHSAGVLSFYCVSKNETMTLLHRFQTTFTQPLHAGLRFYSEQATTKFIKLK